MLPRPLTLRPIAFLLTAAAVCSLTAPAAAQSTTRVSVDSWGVESAQNCDSAAISSDGRWIAFKSAASLVLGVRPGLDSIYVHDWLTGETTIVSLDAVGVQANEGCHTPAISGDGRFVSYYSAADNLAGPSARRQIYLHDRQSGTVSRVSVDSSGTHGNDDSYVSSISEDGRYVCFESDATNLVPGDTNSERDIFMRDLQMGQTIRISVDSFGMQGNDRSLSPSISADGRYVAFCSDATNLVLGDTNDAMDVFVRDLQTGQTDRISLSSSGAENPDDSIDPAISANGQFVAFASRGHVHVHDRSTGQTRLESRSSSGDLGNGDCGGPSLSADGRFLAFTSMATNLVVGDINGQWDCFRRDLQTKETVLISAAMDGAQSDGMSWDVAIADDGRFIAYVSNATNLVPGDANDRMDVFTFNQAREPWIQRTGGCDGWVDVLVANATPAARIALLHGLNGSFTHLSGPCAGLALNLAQPRLATVLTADAAGEAQFTYFVPQSFCDHAIQAVDLATCRVSAAPVLGPRLLSLSMGGTCISGVPLTLDVAEAKPFSTVVLLRGSSGSYLQVTGACSGLTVNLSTPVVMASLTADAAGMAQYTFTPPGGIFCGMSVQAVELGACMLSNLLQL